MSSRRETRGQEGRLVSALVAEEWLLSGRSSVGVLWAGGSLLRLASVDDQEAVDNGALFAVASIPGVSFALTSDHIDRQW